MEFNLSTFCTRFCPSSNYIQFISSFFHSSSSFYVTSKSVHSRLPLLLLYFTLCLTLSSLVLPASLLHWLLLPPTQQTFEAHTLTISLPPYSTSWLILDAILWRCEGRKAVFTYGMESSQTEPPQVDILNFQDV